MLRSRVRCPRPRSSDCNNIRNMNCKGSYRRITSVGRLCLDSFKLLLPVNNSKEIFGDYWYSSMFRQQSSLNSIYFKYITAFYSSKPTNNADKKPVSPNDENETAKSKKPKKELKTYITLLGVDDSMCVSTVEAAKKLADRRNFKLVKVTDFDIKSSRAVYKLVTESQYLKEDWDDSKSRKDKSDKDEKLVSLNCSTNENDVLTKLKMIRKWLTKQSEVRVAITGDVTSGESVFKIIERELGRDGRIVQKRAKNAVIRFQILPPKKSEENVQ